jgi:hypothetical protein
MDRSTDPAALLSEHLQRVFRAAEHVARRSGLGDDEAEDFRGWVLDHLTANDYARTTTR